MVNKQSGGGAPKLEVLQASEAHGAEIAAFFRAVWDPSATPDSVINAGREAAARNVAEPGVPPPTWIALQAGQVLGYVTTIPSRWWNGREAAPAYWIKGLMVLPEFRSGPIGYLVLKAAAAKLPLSAGLAVAPAARRLFEALGYQDLGPIPNLIQPLAPGKILQRVDLNALGLSSRFPRASRPLGLLQKSGLVGLGGWGLGQLLPVMAAGARLGADRGAPLDGPPTAEMVSALWQRVRDSFPAGPVRTPEHLLHRYPVGPESPYQWLASRKGTQLTGLGVLRRPREMSDERLRGIRIATLADLVFPLDRPAAGLALIGAAAKQARRAGADALLASTSSPVLARLLRRQCYVSMGGNVHFLLRATSGDNSSLPRRLDEWWLTRGDGLADEVF